MSISQTREYVFSFPPVTAAGRELPWRAQLLFAAAVFLACLAPAAINGYPVVFTDTESYLVAAEAFRPVTARAFGYAAFIGATGGLWSLWLTIIAQAALSAWLVTRTVALDSPRWPLVWRVPVMLALLAVVVLSHLPWFAAWMQPDLFTSLTLLSLFLLAEHRERLPLLEQVLLIGTLVGCATVHLTHAPLLAGLGVFALGMLAVVVLRRGARDLVLRVRRTAVLALLAAALGWGALGAANYITYRNFTNSVGGSVFLFARLAADGDVATALRPECEAGKPWVACRFLDRLNLTADEFLWRAWSPLREMGHNYGFKGEAAEINPILLRRIWPDWLMKSGVRTVHQFGHFGLGDGMDDESAWIMGDLLPERGLSHIKDAVNATLQATDDLRPIMPRPLAETLAAVGLAVLAGFVVFGLLRHRPDLWWPALLFLVFYIGNAGVIALGGEVHDRYSARLVWVAPLLAGLLALRAACPAVPDRSGRSVVASP